MASTHAGHVSLELSPCTVISSIIASKSSVTNDNVGSEPTQLALLQESMIFVLNT
jgi:hypothetical protein